MNYQAKLHEKQQIFLQNEGEQTKVALEGEGQNQSSSFSTGKWSKKPQVFSVGAGFVVQIFAEDGEQFLSLENSGVHSLDEKPDLNGAKNIELEESEGHAEPPMRPMKPMKPMAPMKPMN